MDKEMKIIMTVAASIPLLGIVIGIAARIVGASAIVIAILNLIVFIGTIITLIIAVISSRNPTNPVLNAIFVLTNKKYSDEKKKRNLDYYITRELKRKGKYSQLFNENFVECKKVELRDRKKKTAVVFAELSNDKRYEFVVEKRNKENTVKSAGIWVINDYRKI